MSIHSLNNQNQFQQLANQTGTHTTNIGPQGQVLGTGGYGTSGGLFQQMPSYYGYSPAVQATSSEMKIRKVKNGWIILHLNEEYVLLESQQVLDFMDLLK